MKILFVCLGNICRSPLAKGIAIKKAKEKNLDIFIDSAATSNYHIGERPCDYSIKIAKLNGIEISNYRARQVNNQDKKFDLIIALDKSNKKNLEKLGFKNIKLLGEYGGFNGADVPDPYFFESFNKGMKEVFDMIEKSIEDLLEKIAKK
jgi:protein-tyrosine phosphatase